MKCSCTFCQRPTTCTCTRMHTTHAQMDTHTHAHGQTDRWTHARMHTPPQMTSSSSSHSCKLQPPVSAFGVQTSSRGDGHTSVHHYISTYCTSHYNNISHISKNSAIQLIQHEQTFQHTRTHTRTHTHTHTHNVPGPAPTGHTKVGLHLPE